MTTVRSTGLVPGPGRVYLLPVRRVGRQKHFGTTIWHDGQMAFCLGYSDDGLTAVYAPMGSMEGLKGAARSARQKLLYRILRRIIRHYEDNAA